MPTFMEIMEGMFARKALCSNERMGQCLFNVLEQKCPEIANEIRCTVLDPFFSEGFVHIPNELFVLLAERLP